MTGDEAAAYLARIGYAGPRSPGAEALAALHRAHLHAVPFENLDIHLRRPIRLDHGALFRKIVGERRGGFCYELNGLFAGLLGFLGYEVSLLSVRVAGKEGGLSPEYDHLALLVEGEGRWLADVGFGRSFHAPLSLDAVIETEAEGTRYRAVETAGDWQVQSRKADGDWAPEYAFSLAPHPLEDFAERCAFHQTSPESHFTRGAVCTLPVGRGRRTLSGRTLIEIEGDTRREAPLEGAAREEALASLFGIRLPAPLPG